MNKSRFILMAGMVVLLAGFVYGVVELFQLRLSSGEFYPPYSSFRADPLGVRLFYESLNRLPEAKVSRFFQANSKLQGNTNRVLFIVGLEPIALEFMQPDDYETIDAFMNNGGRVVLSMIPNSVQSYVGPDSESETNAPNKKKSGKKGKKTEHAILTECNLLESNGISLMTNSAGKHGASVSHEFAYATKEMPDLPKTLSWHTAQWFGGVEKSDGKWESLYELAKSQPVIIERKVGGGSLVLLTDSYLMSNEALTVERRPGLLVWLLGERTEILFDETHLGVEERVGVAALMRRYRLEGAVAGLLLLAGLFIWKNSSSLIPPQEEKPDPAAGLVVEGKGADAAFSSLLRRSLSPEEIVLTGFLEWKTACARDPRVSGRLAEVEKIIAEEKARPPRSRQPIETYRAIHKILNQRNL